MSNPFGQKFIISIEPAMICRKKQTQSIFNEETNVLRLNCIKQMNLMSGREQAGHAYSMLQHRNCTSSSHDVFIAA